MNRIQVEMKDKDVRDKAYQILVSMNAIRQETLSEGNLKKDREKEYVSLAHRLGSQIEAIHGSDKLFAQPIASLQLLLDGDSKHGIEGDQNLYLYDRLQLSYWTKKPQGVEFMTVLSAFAIQFFQPADFVDMFSHDGEYHIWQAMTSLMGKEPCSARNGLSLDLLMQTYPMERLSDPVEMAAAYQEFGYFSVERRFNRPAEVGDKLRKKGYTVIVNQDGVTLRFKPFSTSNFFEVVFGFTECRNEGNYYLVKGKPGYSIFKKNGSRITILGEEHFDGGGKRRVGESDMLELHKSIKGKQRHVYLFNDQALFNHWFDRPLSDNAVQNLLVAVDNLSEKYLTWLIQNDISLDFLPKVSRAAVELIHSLGVLPSKTLLSDIEHLASRVSDLGDFVKTFDVIKATEEETLIEPEAGEKPYRLGKPLGFWQMLDYAGDQAADYIEPAMAAYNMFVQAKPAVKSSKAPVSQEPVVKSSRAPVSQELIAKTQSESATKNLETPLNPIKPLIISYQENRRQQSSVKNMLLSLYDFLAALSGWREAMDKQREEVLKSKQVK